MSRRLTFKQEAFCHRIASGEAQQAAYLACYEWKGDTEVARKKASLLANKPHVAARILQLRDRAARPKILSRQRKLERLHDMVDEQVAPGKQLTSEQLKALEIDARIQGHNEPEKLKVEGMGSLLQKIRRTAPKP